MKYRFFNKEEVLDAIIKDKFYIHTNTSNEARKEALKLCKELSKYLNELYELPDDEFSEEKIYLTNQEVPPSCNYGVIYIVDEYEGLLKLTEYGNDKLLRREIKRQLKNN